MNNTSTTSTRPYLIRAIHEWCSDNGFTPYLAVCVDGTVQVPGEYVSAGEIVLNVSYDATNGLQMSNECIAFKARFGGRPRDIMVPVERVQAIYARETGQGMSFPVLDEASPSPEGTHGIESGVSESGWNGVQQHPASIIAATQPESEEQHQPVVHLVPIQLVPNTLKPQTDGDEPEPPPLPPVSGPRPALKRVK